MRGRILVTCLFLAIVFFTGLAAVFLIKKGTSYLEVHHPPSLAHGQETGSLRAGDWQQGGWRMIPTPDRSYTRASVSRNDFAAAFVTDKGHEGFIEFSRSWRKGIKTFVATNHTLSTKARRKLQQEHNEYWGFYPDDSPLHTLALKGDSRAALAPFLAFRELGDNFNWMFYGDDDTFFFTDAAVNILQSLDHNMPYFLTDQGLRPSAVDHLWWTEKWLDGEGRPQEATRHPHKSAPQCVPCNHSRSTAALPFPFPRGCPCTPTLLCAADSGGVFFKGSRGQCGMPRVPVRTFSMHGGAGAVLSVGLLRNISMEAFEDCVTTTYSTGGDALISICLWQAGYGLTVPDPEWHPEGLHMFDVGGEAQADHEEIVPRVARLMGNLMQAVVGDCAGSLCKLELDHLVTLHLRSRKFPSRRAFSEVTRVLAGLADLAHGRASSWATGARQPDPDQRFVDERVVSALRALQEWQRCQAHSSSEERAVCLKGISLEGQSTSNYLTIMKEARDSPARSLAAYVIRQIFERHPSATGSYGEIPVGRE